MIELVAKRQDDLQQGKPDYLVYAGEQLVGRMYRMNPFDETWFWGVNGVTVDMSVGAVMHGYANGIDDAKAKLRVAFDRWLVWAKGLPAADRKHLLVSAELARIGAAESY